MYLINPYVYILLALIMTSQYVCAVLILCQCAPVSTHTGLLYSQSGDTHAVVEVTSADEVNSRRCTFVTRPYQAIQLIAVNSEGGAIPCFQLWTHRALIRFPLHF